MIQNSHNQLQSVHSERLYDLFSLNCVKSSMNNFVFMLNGAKWGPKPPCGWWLQYPKVKMGVKISANKKQKQEFNFWVQEQSHAEHVWARLC